MKSVIIFGLLLLVVASVFLNVVPPLTVSAQGSPYSFQWWYNQQQVYDTTTTTTDNDDSDDDDGERLDKRLCSNSGIWNGKECIISDPVEKAAYEDAVCDDPKNTKKYASICDKEDEDKVYKDFEKQYREQHPEYYPKAIEPDNPAEEKSDRVSGVASQAQEEQEKKLHDTKAPSLKSLEGKNFDDVVKHDDKNDNDNDNDNDEEDEDNNDDNDDNDSNDDGGSSAEDDKS